GAAQCLDPRTVPADDREFIEVIVEEVNRLNGVVTAFLDYARPLKQSFGPTDVNEVVTRTLRLIQNDLPRNVTITEQLSAELPRVDGDAEQLKQVLINLIQNAAQAIGAAPGEIVIKTSRPDRFGDFRQPELVELQVTDNGPGIPTDQQLNIFVPFFTTKQKGTGLGLAICQRIVKSHNGSISVQSRVGEGSTFIIRLPSLPVEQPAVETPLPEGTPMPGALAPPPDVVRVEPKLSRRERKKKQRA
nr:ATP-binding protein [Myxococcaceae bacterium]